MNWLAAALASSLMSLLAGAPFGLALTMEGAVRDAAAAEPVWSRAVKPPASPPSRIVVEGTATEDGLDPTAIRFPEDGPERSLPTAIMPGRNFLPLMDVRTFGVEERVDYELSGETLTMRCGPGVRPAGLALGSAAFYFPRGIALKLVIDVQAEEGIGISIVTAGGDAPAAPMAKLQTGQVEIALSALHRSIAPQEDELVLTCPHHSATAALQSIMFVPKEPSAAEVSVGTWIWNPGIWIDEPDAILELARKAALQRVFLQLPIEDGAVAESGALAALVERLGENGIEVHAVEGDPAMVTEAGRENALARVAAISRYQNNAIPAARLDGLQFDIEPYLLEAHSRDAAASWLAWAESIGALSDEWGAPVSVVVPFWMLEEAAGPAALERAGSAISQIVVMAYRTSPQEVFALSEPWLYWGSERKMPIAIALENGPLSPEFHRTYIRDETGELILTYRGGEGTLTLYSGHRPAPIEGFAYAMSHEVAVDRSRISFMNNGRQLADVRKRLSNLLGAWSSFDGLMLHELMGSERRTTDR